MYELWITDGHYIAGKKVGRNSKNIDTLKKRAEKTLKDSELQYRDDLSTFVNCIWIEKKDSHIPVGVIQPVKETTRARK